MNNKKAGVEVVRRGTSSLAVQRWRKLIWSGLLTKVGEIDPLLREKLEGADEGRNRSDLIALLSFRGDETLEDIEETRGRNLTLRNIRTRAQYLCWGGDKMEVALELAEVCDRLILVFFEEEDLNDIDLDGQEDDILFQQALPALTWLGAPSC